MTLRLGEITSTGLAALEPKPPLLIPVGIVEEHGPHLPLDADTIQAVATCEAVAARIGAMVAPPFAYGNCSSTKNFPGSFSLSFDTLRAFTREVLDDAARHGFRTVALVSGHAGGAHMRALKLAAEEHVAAHATRVFVLADWDLLRDFDAGDVPKWDGHAGALETSRLLALRPDLVKGSAAAHRVEFPEHLVEPHPEKRFPTGVMGDPTKASAELGRHANAHIVERMIDVLRQKE